MSFRKQEPRLELLKEFIQNWNIIEDLKGLLCINCIASIQKDIEQFRKNGTVDTEIDPDADQLLKNVITMNDLEKLNIEPITSFEQLFDTKAEIHLANIELEKYWESVILKREAKRQKSIVDAVKYNIEMEEVRRHRAAYLLQSFVRNRNERKKKLNVVRVTEISTSSPILSPSQSSNSSRKILPYSPDQISSNRIVISKKSKKKIGVIIDSKDSIIKSKREGTIDKCANAGCIIT